MWKKLSLCCFLFIGALSAEKEEDCNWPKEWRKKALVRLDVMSGKAVPFASRTFSVGAKVGEFGGGISSLDEFALNHGYFSCDRPLIGIVTTDKADIEVVQKALLSCMESKNPLFVEIAVGEILTKALAYRALEKGDKIKIPTLISGKISLIEYVMDEEIDLWHGMPAFGFLPLKKGGSPILLFRGTDFSLLSKKSWASILSDLDTEGVGLSVFRGAQTKIRDWLIRAKKSSGVKSRAMGFSLGGILSVYTAFFEGDLLMPKGSIAFNSPGVSNEIFQKWPKNSSVVSYATQGDLVSKLGKMVGKAFEISEKKQLCPIEAHTKLMVEDRFSLAEILIEQENKHRFTME